MCFLEELQFLLIDFFLFIVFLFDFLGVFSHLFADYIVFQAFYF